MRSTTGRGQACLRALSSLKSFYGNVDTLNAKDQWDHNVLQLLMLSTPAMTTTYSLLAVRYPPASGPLGASATLYVHTATVRAWGSNDTRDRPPGEVDEGRLQLCNAERRTVKKAVKMWIEKAIKQEPNPLESPPSAHCTDTWTSIVPNSKPTFAIKLGAFIPT